MQEDAYRRTTGFSSFATMGVLSTTQELARTVLIGLEEPDRELVAEETLMLVATATARAAAMGLRGLPEEAQAVVPTLAELPFTYRDYLIGGAMISKEDPSLVETGEHVYERLGRKQEFYAAHLAEGQFPGEHALRDVMELWMGRISPPRMPEAPQERLERMGLVPRLLTHCKLVLAAARRLTAQAQEA